MYRVMLDYMYCKCALTLPLQAHKEDKYCGSAADIVPDLVQTVVPVGRRNYTDRWNHIDHKHQVVLDRVILQN